jgi:hypothetical protein
MTSISNFVSLTLGSFAIAPPAKKASYYDWG